MSFTIKTLIILVTFFSTANTKLFAQKVLLNGKILFERKVNMHKQMDAMSSGDGNNWIEMAKKNTPKYQITNFDLLFGKATTLYKKSKEQPPSGGNMRGMFNGREDDENNFIFQDLKQQQLVEDKQIFEKLVHIKDSLPKIEWKLSNEFKKIADFNCRKATGIIMDSIYIIAYYTDAIYPSAGPCTINGLPGMILGMVIPRLNTSYFATQVIPGLEQDSALNITPIIKGKPTSFSKLQAEITTSTEEWGKRWKNRILWGLYF